jgi:putative DNA primase/helicase
MIEPGVANVGEPISASRLVALLGVGDVDGALKINSALAEEIPFAEVVEDWCVEQIKEFADVADEARRVWHEAKSKADPALREIAEEAFVEWYDDRIAIKGKARLANLVVRLEVVKPKLVEANADIRRKIFATVDEMVAAEAKQQEKPEPEEPEVMEVFRPAFAKDDPIDDGKPAELSLTAPYDNAREFARRYCWKAGWLAVYAWGDKFWEWNGRLYQFVTEADMKARMYSFLDNSVRREGTDHHLVRFRPKPKLVTDLLDGLAAGLALPSWYEPPMRLDTGKRAGDVLMFKNTLLDVKTGAKVPASPKLWIHDGLGYEWNPNARCPGWLAFLASSFPGDQEAQDSIEELLGLSMTEDVSFQKGALLVGKSRSGKGTILRVGEGLTASFVSVDLDKWMSDDKACECLISKKMIAFTDVRLKEGQWYGQRFDPGGVDFKSAQRLLKITAADKLTLARKYRSAWEGVLPGKVWIASNRHPNFNDAVLPTRFIKNAFEVSFAGREDTTLSERLLSNELAGIAARCLARYHRARDRGRLIQPASGARLGADIAKNSDAFTQFLTETFVLDREGAVTYTVAYEQLRFWCGKHGRTDLLDKIKPQNFRRWINGVPGYEGIENAPRPHGTPRRLAKLRLRTRTEREDEWEE